MQGAWYGCFQGCRGEAMHYLGCELRRIPIPRTRMNKVALASIVGGANSVERGYQGMADDGSQQRKPDFRTAVEDVKALAKVLATQPQFVLGRRLNFGSPSVLAAIGVVATLVLALMVVIVLVLTHGARAVTTNAALIAALVALGGVFTAQLVNTGLEAQRAHEAALQKYLEQVGMLLTQEPKTPNFGKVARAQTLAVLKGLQGDSDRKRVLMLFLSESKLLDKARYDFNLRLADLSYAHLGGLRDGILSCKNLSETHLEHANLRETDLRNTDLTSAYLEGANLEGADLSKADLRGADLGRTDLTNAKGITVQELEQQAASLKGAIMPDGSKHP
jgi:Pentapeptide repeats (8 copies)